MTTISKQLLLISILVILQVTIFGQRYSSYLGIKGGSSVSNLSGNSSNSINSNYKSRNGTDLEILFESKVSNILTYQGTGLEFSSQGGEKEGFQPFLTSEQYSQYFPTGQAPKYLYANFKKQQKINFLFLTSMLRVSTNDEKRKFRPYVSGGFYIGYLLSANEILKGVSIVFKDYQLQQPINANAQSFDETRNIKNDLHKFNVGINGSAGFLLDVGKMRFYIEGAGNYGLININKQADDGKNYIKSISARIGFSYNVGRVFSWLFRTS